MTENERLRWLLTEVRQAPNRVLADDLLARIESVLSLPPSDTEQELAIVQKERDTAFGHVTAEIAKRHMMEADLIWADFTEKTRQKELAEAKSKAETAYQRGAEAMREAAARRAHEIYQGCLPPDPWVVVEDIKVLVEEIRALPVPEDKP